MVFNSLGTGSVWIVYLVATSTDELEFTLHDFNSRPEGSRRDGVDVFSRLLHLLDVGVRIGCHPNSGHELDRVGRTQSDHLSLDWLALNESDVSDYFSPEVSCLGPRFVL